MKLYKESEAGWLDWIESLPTLCVGQDADLKVDCSGQRVWLSRMGPEDGETHRIHVERLIKGRWILTEKRCPFE